MLVSAAVVTLAIAATVDASSAAAAGSELCTVAKQNPCLEANMVKEKTTISAKLKTGQVVEVRMGLFGTLTCAVSTTTFKTTSTGSATEHILLDMEAWTFGTCKFGGNNCTSVQGSNVGVGMEAVNGKYVTNAASADGVITLERNKKGDEWGLNANCPGLGCALRTGKMEIALFGGLQATIGAGGEPFNTVEVTGGKCPVGQPLEYDGSYEISSPKSMFGVPR